MNFLLLLFLQTLKLWHFKNNNLLFRTVGESKSTLWRSETCHLVSSCVWIFFSLFYFFPLWKVVTLVVCLPDVGVPPHSFPNLFLLLFLETESSSVCLHWFCETIYLCQPGEFYEEKKNCLYDYKVQLYMNMWALSMTYVGEITAFFSSFFLQCTNPPPYLAPPPLDIFFGPLLNKDCQVNEIF